MRTLSLRGALPLAALLGLAGCSDDPAGPADEPFLSLTVDATTGWTFVRLGDSALPVQVADAATSQAWDIAFFASSVMLNGGAAGPGDVQGLCLCQNQAATDAEIMAMTPDSEAAAFTAVSVADIPADEEAWESDVLAPAIDGWYRYDPVAHTVSAATDRAWKVRAADGTSFAKVRVAALENAVREHAGSVTLEFATQSAAGAPLSEVKSLTVDLSSGPVHVDLVEGQVSDAEDWDLRLEGYTIRVNGGVSGSGSAGAIDAGEPFAGITDAGDVPAQVYRGDRYGGVFAAKPWYRYNLTGDHQIWPTYDVYLVRSAGAVYKVQLTGYYQASTGDPRHITFRYAKIAG